VNPFEIATSLAQPLPLFLRRLATLQGETGTQRVGIATCDGSGAILFRREVQGFPMPRIGAGCSLWPLYQAMMRPMMPIHQVVEQPGPIPERFDAYAIAEVSHPSGFSGPQLVEATMLIVSQREKSSEDSHTHPVGASCRICPRKTCVARREASILVEEF
jgi:predicted transcriptional regulator